MPHEEETGMADPDVLQLKSIPGVIEGYAHKRVSKDGLPDLTAVMLDSSVLLIVINDFPHARHRNVCLPCL